MSEFQTFIDDIDDSLHLLSLSNNEELVDNVIEQITLIIQRYCQYYPIDNNYIDAMNMLITKHHIDKINIISILFNHTFV